MKDDWPGGVVKRGRGEGSVGGCRGGGSSQMTNQENLSSSINRDQFAEGDFRRGCGYQQSCVDARESVSFSGLSKDVSAPGSSKGACVPERTPPPCRLSRRPRARAVNRSEQAPPNPTPSTLPAFTLHPTPSPDNPTPCTLHHTPPEPLPTLLTEAL